jgi:hypothetical protein
MNREPLEILELPPSQEALESRLAAVERAYEVLLERLRRYERERAEIRTRLAGILARLGG